MPNPESQSLSEVEITHSPELRDLVVNYFTETALKSDRDITVKIRPRDSDQTILWLTHFNNDNQLTIDDKRLTIEAEEIISDIVKKSGAEHRFTIYTTLEIDSVTGEIFDYYEESLEYDEHGSWIESTIDDHDGLHTNRPLTDRQKDILEALDDDDSSTFTQDKLDCMINLLTTSV